MLSAISLAIFGFLAGVWLGKLQWKKNREATAPSYSLYKPEIYLAYETLHYLRQGLTPETAQKVVEIIKRIIPVDAVAITDTQQIIGFAGAGCNHHRLGKSIITNVTKEAINAGKVMVINNGEFNCSIKDCSCPLKAAVIVPLFCDSKVVGTLKLYQVNRTRIDDYLLNLAKGIGQILSIQIELAEKEHQKQLAAKAKLEALQAQIRPHFLFNVINTIIYCSRNDPDKARELLIEFSKFFRKTLKSDQDFITLSEEIEYIKTYITLEQARFGDRLKVAFNVESHLLNLLIPGLIIQPLVENAILHGVSPLTNGGEVTITCKEKNKTLYVLVRDNGKGIPRDRQAKILIPTQDTNNGLALSNIDQRLISLYGPKYRLKIKSQEHRGTMVLIKIPLGGVNDARSMCKMSKLYDSDGRDLSYHALC
ncbi:MULTISPECIES: histidine kinase [unclassified Carboxydocella]|uniref:histidine kinase n=1 Tax=unclassified Carboxydocella TaxID=2685367 RepID=UPI0009C98365|nr:MULTISPECIES: histidine kinase [unclassified Carboxydocella]GAW29690.1 histidine kinase [Carboxydocella sp. ULO1]GAW31418.1 histidine kinase [Carboxydocella sp. JDF658]